MTVTIATAFAQYSYITVSEHSMTHNVINGYVSMMADRGLFIKVIVAMTLIYVDYFILSGVYQLLRYIDYDLNEILKQIKK